MQEHSVFTASRLTPHSAPTPFAAGQEAWRAEVDEIIAAIHPRCVEEDPETTGCAATLVLQQRPEGGDARPTTGDLPLELAQTQPGVPCEAALKVPFVSEPLKDQVEQSTSPVHPAAQASLRAACIIPATSTDIGEAETEVDQASTREHPVEYPLPPSPFAHACNAEPVRGGWVFEPATSESALLREVVQAATEVHRNLGPGLLTHVYTQCLARELNLRGLRTECDVSMAVSYKGNTLEDAFRIDLLVEGSVLVDVQGVARVESLHEARLRSFLVHSGLQFALLINFHEPILIDGVRSMER